MNWEAMMPEQRDALVAEKVFGRRVHKENTWGRWLLLRDDKVGLTEPIPPYTQSMDAAWLVLQNMAARYDSQSEYLDDVFSGFKDELFSCSGDEIYPASRLLLDMAKWTPDHICRLALEAVEADEK